MTGIICSLPHDKFYGFIQSGGNQYFFHKDDFEGHWTDLMYDHYQGHKIEVSFVSVDSDKGPRAASVRRVDAGIVMP